MGALRRSTADMHHGSRRLEEARFADMMACLLALNGFENVGTEFRIAGSGPQAPIKIVLHLREETGANLAVGSESKPAASAAERLSDRRDDADLAHAILK